MGKIVVLIRHTEAQTMDDQSKDAGRALTEKGKLDAKKIARSIKPILADKKCVLLSSPLIRAMETAAYIGKKLDLEVASAAWIAEGSLHQLQETLATFQAEVLILVGHEPTLSRWIDSCSHVNMPMKKGCACALQFKEDISEGADILWYLDKNAVPWNE